MGKLNEYEKKHLRILRKIAPECTLFLKKNGDFPLKEAGEIAVYGSGARRTVKGGTGSGDVNSRFYITIERGLEQVGFTVTTKDWLDAYDDIWEDTRKKFIADVKKEARKQHTMAVMIGMGITMAEPEYQLPLSGAGDVAIYVLARNAGEGDDRKAEAGDLFLTQTEIRDILELNRRYAHFMLVLNVGGMIDLSPVKEVGNILILSQLGAVTGRALADILLGKSYPSGKLTTTWGAWKDYAGMGTFGCVDDTDYTEGIYVGYRYFDSIGKEPDYPFGYGLGYTEFAIGEAKCSLEGTKAILEVPVTNIGDYAGKEVVQVYVSVPWGKLDQPYQTLAAFAKTKELSPKETQTLRLTFGLEELASYDTETASYLLEAGKYLIRVGNSSRNTKACAMMQLSEDVCVRKVTNVGGKANFTDWRPDKTADEAEESLPLLEINADAFATLHWPEAAKASERAVKIAASLTDEELVKLCIGSFKSGMGAISAIGSASVTVAGAAGETYGGVAGVPLIVMADGPAGLRLTQKYVRDEKGAHAIGSALPAGIGDFLGPVAKNIMGLLDKKPKGKVQEQYCTAIPIGTGLAQSWNLDVCHTCGEIVGDEMELFGVHLWLAPALNIHRNPLCGRNFEYYSEDPLISGKTAAAITQGVQKKKGRGVTIKHYCCNNQEKNRFNSSSNVNERALREIYLRGFQICLTEAAPAALMTSYNLLNGVHTSEREDILKTVIRKEWGWDGLIMTDWVMSMMGSKGKYRIAKSAPTLHAGNDLFMPGCGGDYKLALNAMQGKTPEFRLTRAEVEQCAASVIETALRLRE
ncbi:MAG: glycoside hydrolase family 3 C-terminal domain-containing protein [Muribaculaceae bacterium]|nr:glycoside hydrolase family 3 C-terminal domain-containing protein [Muribaculaceae bacterium]